MSEAVRFAGRLSFCHAVSAGQDARLYVSQDGRRYIATSVRDAVL